MPCMRRAARAFRHRYAFKIDARRIVIFKELPVLQCGSCGEYLIAVLAQVDRLLAEADERAELEIMSYAA